MATSPIAAWRQFNTHYRLEASRCTQCEKIHIPARTYCPCGSTTLVPQRLTPHGTLKSFTQITAAPTEFKQMSPYCIGIIALDDGPKIVAHISDVSFEQLHINQRMRGVLRKMGADETGIIHYGIKFIPSNISPERVTKER